MFSLDNVEPKSTPAPVAVPFSNDSVTYWLGCPTRLKTAKGEASLRVTSSTTKLDDRTVMSTVSVSFKAPASRVWMVRVSVPA